MWRSYLSVSIKQRFSHSDKDGSVTWSEAAAESVFSVLKLTVTGRGSPTLDHASSICRVVLNGPKAATEEAESLMEKALNGYPAHNGLEFTTKYWQMRFVQNLVSQLIRGNRDNRETCESDSDD